MIHHEMPTAENPENNNHCERCSNDVSSAAYVLGASIVVAAIIFSGTLFYIFKTAEKRVDTVVSAMQTSAGQLAALSAGGSGNSAPSQPTAGAQPSAAPAAPTGPVDIKLAANTPYLGNGTAKVTVVEYADYRCPFCEQLFNTVLPDIKSKYIDTGKIKFIYQDFAFLGADSNTAAEASHCAADQNKFWQYHDYLFKNQGSETGNWASAANQKIFAQTLGLNTTQFNQCLDSGKYKQEVLNETAAGRTYGVSGTPTVFVNGVAIVGAQPASTFTDAIDAALK